MLNRRHRGALQLPAIVPLRDTPNTSAIGTIQERAQSPADFTAPACSFLEPQTITFAVHNQLLQFVLCHKSFLYANAYHSLSTHIHYLFPS